MPDLGTPGRSGNVPARFDPAVTQREHGFVSLQERQLHRLGEVTKWAKRIRETLGHVLEAHGDRVHFRPGSNGVAMISLLSDRPQRGRSKLKDLGRVARNFEVLFEKHCQDIGQGRETREKALQSFLISEAYRNGRAMVSLNDASGNTNEPVELVFVTDEIPVPTESGEIVCDILALRRDGRRCTPVLIELKTERLLTRLVQQVESYSALMDEFPEEFEALFSAILGEPIRFDAAAERWIVWPSSGRLPDPHEDELAEERIRIAGYSKVENSFSFSVGIGRPRCSACKSTDAVVPVVHGEPGPELEAQAARGEVILGGCIIHEDSRPWHCKQCGQDFGRPVST